MNRFKVGDKVTDEPKNLIPEIAKMLGVEVWEEFKVNKIMDTVFMFTKTNLTAYSTCIDIEYVLTNLICGEYTIQKLPQTPKLTEAERVILEELFKKYTKIIRTETTELWVYNHSKDWKELAALSHLFQFIGEYRKEYDIEELLKGE